MVSDGLCCFDDSCTGDAHAFDKLAQMVEEIYIPAKLSISHLVLLENLTNLIYIEVAPDNPDGYSVNGELYTKDGKKIKGIRKLLRRNYKEDGRAIKRYYIFFSQVVL